MFHVMIATMLSGICEEQDKFCL